MQVQKTINWYDRFSKIYDWMSDYPYIEPRIAPIETFQLQDGDVVLDLFVVLALTFKTW